MNAVRMRKENQVISVTEKRLVLEYARQEKRKHENEVMTKLNELALEIKYE
jgi:hypothetical protein